MRQKQSGRKEGQEGQGVAHGCGRPRRAETTLQLTMAGPPGLRAVSGTRAAERPQDVGAPACNLCLAHNRVAASAGSAGHLGWLVQLWSFGGSASRRLGGLFSPPGLGSPQRPAHAGILEAADRKASLMNGTASLCHTLGQSTLQAGSEPWGHGVRKETPALMGEPRGRGEAALQEGLAVRSGGLTAPCDRSADSTRT